MVLNGATGKQGPDSMFYPSEGTHKSCLRLLPVDVHDSVQA